MSDSASANHYQMRHQSQIAASQNPHLFFPTEPRSRSSSSRPTRPINGFLRNGNNTSHQNYEKMSSTMSRPVWNILFSNENISNLNYFWWWKINQIIIITLQLLNENGTAHDKRNSADAYCNGNGRTSILSENSGISLLHHPRSLSPLPHQRSKVCHQNLKYFQYAVYILHMSLNDNFHFNNEPFIISDFSIRASTTSTWRRSTVISHIRKSSINWFIIFRCYIS